MNIENLLLILIWMNLYINENVIIYKLYFHYVVQVISIGTYFITCKFI